MFVGVDGREFLPLGAEGIDEVRNEIFVSGTFFEGSFFVFYNDFVIGDFDDFFAGNEEFGVDDAFHDGAPYDDLLDEKIIGIDGKIDNLSKLAAFLGFDFEGEEVEV